jgi:hypothetical protein
VNEFRAELDRDGKRSIAVGEDATSDSFSSLENDDGKSLFDQCPGRRESRDAGTENDDLNPRLLALHETWTPGRRCA